MIGHEKKNYLFYFFLKFQLFETLILLLLRLEQLFYDYNISAML